jgi:RNA polymerase subunit RPABC4/transcription elongation factor Spt4
MHELLHYWLHPAGEHLCYDSNFIFQNKGIEWQANEGTAQALMPEKLFMKMYIYYSGNINNLSDYFIVSKIAVEYRIKNLKLFPPSKLRGFLYKTKKARHCTICGNLEIKHGDNHCKICGNDFFFFGTSYKWSVYSEGPDNENSCPECELLLDKNARYCRRCGAASTLFHLLIPWYKDIKIMEETPIYLW